MISHSWKNYKGLIIAAVVIGLTLLTHFDAVFYKTPIAEITSIKQVSSQKTKDYFGNQDKTVTQKLSLKFLNTKRQGQNMTISNQYVDSQVLSQKYRVGQEILLSHKKWWSIIGQKRDTILVFTLALMLGLVVYFANRLSLQIIISLVLNFLFFILAILFDINFETVSPIIVFAALTIIFTFITLFMVLGKSRQFVIVFAATVLSTAAGVGIGAIAINLNGANGIHFEYMDFITQFPIPLFYSELLIGVLGASMDEASDISAMLLGMQRERAERTFKDYFMSGMTVGRDIVGSLTNVLFMVFIADTLPMVFLYLRNGNTWSYTIEMTMLLGLLSTIISAIAIVLTVPITSWLAATILTRKKQVIA
ncbi:YibE/F family protein [Oenococcus sicerae]|uniref:YibE/F family protein n=1 Tax=Oenococcus sicerae TaxID=2203724 RepID=A0AAJ1RCM0_9LACO|nr:YibE/F family protein [Oenococcus sicerae]MDN6900297.1 YibE/F family protein [Oenococcus sicerae]